MNPAFYMMLLRQTTNNFLFVMDVTLVCILALYIISYLRAYGRSAWGMVRVRAAIWIGLHVIGLTMQRAWGIVLYRAYDRGENMMAVEQHFPVYLAGSLVAVIGLAGTIYTFTPIAGQENASRWKRAMPLILAIIVASLFTVVMESV
jgi:hypothetical protein